MSIVKSITTAFVPIRKEGWPFVAAFFVVSLLLGWLWDPLFWIGLALTAWCAYFFRDPPRITPLDDDLVISPADGIISAIGPVVPPAELNLGDGERLRISVFMNVFSVHVNRAPVRGKIERIVYTPGQFMNADMDKASTNNERNALIFDSAHGQIAAVQIAGLIARRILCWASEGDGLAAGERFGLIRFGSRVDVYLPLDTVPQVYVGQNAIAGETILAAWGRTKPALLTQKD